MSADARTEARDRLLALRRAVFDVETDVAFGSGAFTLQLCDAMETKTREALEAVRQMVEGE